jgi:peptide chain release factor subunit 1
MKAIALSAESLSGVALVKEQELLSQFFSEIAKDSGLYCFGANETMQVLTPHYFVSTHTIKYECGVGT